jgi:Tol biopolymer transport system component
LLLLKDNLEASGVEPDALIEEARQYQRQRIRRRIVVFAVAVLLAVLGFGSSQLLRAGGGVHAVSPASAPLQLASSGLLVFSRVDAGESHIMVVDPSRRTRPRDLGPGWGPRWSPDGKQLVFMDGPDRGRRLRLFVMNADGSGRHLLPVPSPGSLRFEDWAPAWSPDGNRIAFTRTIWHEKADHSGTTDLARSAIYVLDLLRGGLRRVTTLSDSGELPAYVTWSPDGRRLAYLGSGFGPYALGGFSFLCAGLHVINADGTGDHILAAASRTPKACTAVWEPAWSPDGDWIAFARSTPSPGGGIDLYLISSNGEQLHRLTHQPQVISVSPSWSADGKRIAFAFGRRDRGGPGPGGPNRVRTVVVIDRDGSHRQTVASFRGHIFGGPDWQRR